jgi:hypothetical protein
MISFYFYCSILWNRPPAGLSGGECGKVRDRELGHSHLEVEYSRGRLEYPSMATLASGAIALVVGMLALGMCGATPRRRIGMRASLLVLGSFSTFAALAMLYRAGGFPALAIVGSGLTTLVGIGVVIWYFVAMIASVDEALTKREPLPPTDFAFLHQQASQPSPAQPKRPTMSQRMGLTMSRERIASMTWFFRKPPS